MSAETRELISWVLGTTISLSIVIGLITKFVMMPYLREHLVKPMKQVEKQVSENHHSNKVPTVLDRIDDVQSAVDEMREEMKGMATMYEGHLSWSERWVNLVEREIDFIKHSITQHMNHKD